MANLFWLQGGACFGNTMSFLNAEAPSACDLVTDFGINVLWQPSLGLELGDEVKSILEKCVSGEIKLDIFLFEGIFQWLKARKKNALSGALFSVYKLLIRLFRRLQ